MTPIWKEWIHNYVVVVMPEMQGECKALAALY